MTNLQQARLNFLEEGVKYYSEDTRRRAVVEKKCKYRTLARKNCRKCMIGRHIPDENYKSKFEGTGINTLLVGREIFKSLPTKVQELGLNFLRELQFLHDDPESWNKRKGMTQIGKRKINRIKKLYIDETN